MTQCFGNASILDRELDIVNRGMKEDSDPFLAAEKCMN